jgi:hypothetical protein
MGNRPRAQGNGESDREDDAEQASHPPPIAFIRQQLLGKYPAATTGIQTWLFDLEPEWRLSVKRHKALNGRHGRRADARWFG